MGASLTPMDGANAGIAKTIHKAVARTPFEFNGTTVAVIWVTLKAGKTQADFMGLLPP